MLEILKLSVATEALNTQEQRNDFGFYFASGSINSTEIRLWFTPMQN